MLDNIYFIVTIAIIFSYINRHNTNKSECLRFVFTFLLIRKKTLAADLLNLKKKSTEQLGEEVYILIKYKNKIRQNINGVATVI